MKVHGTKKLKDTTGRSKSTLLSSSDEVFGMLFRIFYVQ